MITVHKPKLPKHLSYVLKTSLLEAVLEQAGMDCCVNLDYWTPQSGGSILEAHYVLPNKNVDHTRVQVRAGSVPAGERRRALDLLESQVLPEFVTWLSRLLSLPEGSPILFGGPYFNARYGDGLVVINHDFAT